MSSRNKSLNATYDAEVWALYVCLSTERITRTEEQLEGRVMVDYDVSGNVVGYEFLLTDELSVRLRSTERRIVMRRPLQLQHVRDDRRRVEMVGVSHGRSHVGVAKHALNVVDRDAVVEQVAGVSVTQRMRSQALLETGLGLHLDEHLTDVRPAEFEAFSRAVQHREHRVRAVVAATGSVLHPLGDEGACLGVERDDAPLLVLAAQDGDDATLEVEILRSQCQAFSASQTGPPVDHDQRGVTPAGRGLLARTDDAPDLVGRRWLGRVGATLPRVRLALAVLRACDWAARVAATIQIRYRGRRDDRLLSNAVYDWPEINRHVKADLLRSFLMLKSHGRTPLFSPAAVGSASYTPNSTGEHGSLTIQHRTRKAAER